MEIIEFKKSEFERVSESKSVMESIKELGISVKFNSSLYFPSVSSGYSMGEIVRVFCGDNLIYISDNTTSYSGKYKGRETHGYIVVKLKKKDLKEFVKLSNEIDRLNEKINFSKEKTFFDRCKDEEKYYYNAYMFLRGERLDNSPAGVSAREKLESVQKDRIEYEKKIQKFRDDNIAPVRAQINSIFENSVSLVESKVKRISVY